MAYKTKDTFASVMSEALKLASEEYNKRVVDLSSLLVEGILSGKIPNLESFESELRIKLRSEDWVTVQAKSHAVALISKNATYCFDEGILDMSSFKDGIPWGEVAYFAMDRDVTSEAQAAGSKHGIDLWSEDLWDESKTRVFSLVKDRVADIAKFDRKSGVTSRNVDVAKTSAAINMALRGEQPRLANHAKLMAELAWIYEHQFD